MSNVRGSKRSWWRSRWVKVVAGLAAVALVVFVAALDYVLHNAEPILRKRVIATLAERFNAPVELDHLDISLFRGIEVRGQGLRIENVAPQGLNGTDTAGQAQPEASASPLVSVDSFTFRTTLRGLLRQPTHVSEVDVDGMRVDVPAANRRVGFLGPRQHVLPADRDDPKVKAKISLVVERIHATNVQLLIEIPKPGKPAREVDIEDLLLKDVGASQPFTYEAQLINPVPRGDIHTAGHFGPWVGDNPRATPVDGDYTFAHADMGTIKGIGGTLSSAGHFAGVLDHMTIDGTADVPNFSLDVSHHAVPLHTKFHAFVDGTDGDTTLDPVEARLLHTDFTCRGKVVDIHGQGHDIALDVSMPHGRIEDVLQLGVKTNPPLMNGTLSMQAKLHIPPGKVRVMQKLDLTGNFEIDGVRFNNAKWQDKVDGLSLRAQGRPEEAEQAEKNGVAGAQSQVDSKLTATVALSGGVMSVSNLNYSVPGAQVLMNGVYSTSGDVFEFRGHVRTEAEASQMVTGWKSVLLMPFDKMLKKDGAGVQLPVSISGTQGDVHFGLATHGADETSQQIEAELMKSKAAKKDAKDAQP